MEQLLPIILIGQSLVLLSVVVCLIKLFRHTSRLEKSFAKMGYVVREDLKQVFSESAQQAKDFTQQASTQNQQILEQSMAKILDESGRVMEGAIAEAHQQAATIVNQAHLDRQSILKDAQVESQKYLAQLADYSTQAIEWAMSQLLKEEVSLEEHQQIIQTLISVYLDEQKRR